eukprot:4115944-Pyramimonas_sp.AAC.1
MCVGCAGTDEGSPLVDASVRAVPGWRWDADAQKGCPRIGSWVDDADLFDTKVHKGSAGFIRIYQGCSWFIG